MQSLMDDEGEAGFVEHRSYPTNTKKMSKRGGSGNFHLIVIVRCKMMQFIASF